jgi:hypothetical protein
MEKSKLEIQYTYFQLQGKFTYTSTNILLYLQYKKIVMSY